MRQWVVALLGAASFGLAQPAAAQTAWARKDDGLGSSHTLLGHAFLPPTLEPAEDTAFVMSYFGLRADVADLNTGGVATSRGTWPLRTRSTTLTLDMAAALNDYVGLYGSFIYRMYIGGDDVALYARGAGSTVGGRFGAVVRLFRIEKTGTQVSMRASFGTFSGTRAPFIRIGNAAGTGDLIDEAISGTLLTYLVVPDQQSFAGGSIDAAQALSKAFSFQASVRTQAQLVTSSPRDAASNEAVKQSNLSPQVLAGAAFCVDAVSVGVPLAMMAEYAIVTDAPLVASNDNSLSTGPTHSVAFSAFLSGRSTLQLGVGVSYILNAHPLEVDDGRGTTITTSPGSGLKGSFLFRYLW